ncbi:MAG: carbamoyltransferase HypF, partial [Gammaproteobacteria bacterium]|nr:carbamoyltransferase HypF [Gammaproteobacteria bacterium]
REPWRSAAALCWESGHDWPAQPGSASILYQAWQRQLNSPQSSAAGRLFDAAAALTGTCTHASYEGQGPMLLEAIAEGHANAVELPLTTNAAGLLLSDWEPLLKVLLDDGQSVAARAGCFHASLAMALHEQARAVRKLKGVTQVGLSGGVFQNRLLTSQVVQRLQADGFSVYFPSEIPVNDAGICFGQVLEHGFAGQLS